MKKSKQLSIFLLSGLAVWAYYRYRAMNKQEKRQVRARVNEAAKQLISPFVPDSVRDRIAKQDSIDNDPEYGKTYL